jgi:flagellar P-ring protein precursor FlgI
VAVAYGNLTVAITNTQTVSQPNSFTGNGNTINSGNTNSGVINNNGRGSGNGGGQGIHTQVVDNTTTNVQEGKHAMVVLNDMPTVEDVAFALNSMGATPRELMSILQSIKDAGALNAELVLE